MRSRHEARAPLALRRAVPEAVAPCSAIVGAMQTTPALLLGLRRSPDCRPQRRRERLPRV